MKYRMNFTNLLLIVVLAWITNFLLSPSFGFYTDDWASVAGVAKYKLFANYRNPFDWLLTWPHGRPVGWFFLTMFGIPGRAADDVVVHYFIANLIIAVAAWLVYLIVERKYGASPAAVSVVAFLLSPLNTNQPNLTIVFLLYVAVLFCLAGVYLFQRQNYLASFLFGALSLLSYESAFLFYAAAPIFAGSVFSRRYLRSQILHGFGCAVVLGVYWVVRSKVFHIGLDVHPGQSSSLMFAVERIFPTLAIYPALAVRVLGFTIMRGFETISWGGGVVFIASATYLLFMFNRPIVRETAEERKGASRESPAIISEMLTTAALALIASIILTGYTTVFPSQPFDGRDTRIFLTSFLFVGLLASAVMLSARLLVPSRFRAAAGAAALALMIYPLSNNAYSIQRDYVTAWTVQRDTIRSAIPLLCDLEPRDVVALEVGWRSGIRAIESHSFGYATALADTYDWGTTPIMSVPRLLLARQKWREAATLDAKGQLGFSHQVFNAIPALANAPIEPGRIIVLTETRSGSLQRQREPWIVGGVNVIKSPPASMPEKCFWDKYPMTGDVAPILR